MIVSAFLHLFCHILVDLPIVVAEELQIARWNSDCEVELRLRGGTPTAR